MLFVKTEIKDQNWLRYILDEFCRIEKADFKIEIASQTPEGKPYISYASTKGADILEKVDSDLSGGTKYLGEELFVLNDSLDPSVGTKIEFDIFWNAFYFLS